MMQTQTRKKLFPMTNTKKKKKKNTGYLIAALVITAILAYTMVSLLTGNITPVVRVTTMLCPVWFSADLALWCTIL